MRLKYFLFVCILPCLASNCNQTPIYPITPAIVFLDINPKSVFSPKDSIVIKFSFTDGDGNLGFAASENTNDVLYKILRNNATSVNFAARLPLIAPIGNKKSLEGEISLQFSSFGLVAANLQGDSIAYQITIMDRDSTLSNTITTPKIWVRK